MKKIVGVCVWLIALLGIAGCQTNEKMSDDLSGSITAVGSSALLPLVEVASEQFQEHHKEVLINVQGGGSGTGLSQVVSGIVEIGNSDIFAEEKKIDITQYNVQDNKVAVVGIGPIVSLDAQVDSLTQQQLIAIFTGEITNWKEVGGADLPIVVINRANGSGSRKTFETFGLNGREPMTAQEQDNTGTVRKLVAQTSGAISYVSFSYFDDAHYTAVSIDGVKPSAENVATNDWKIWSYEHMYTSTTPDAITKAFIEYMYTDKVQKEIVVELGYIPITVMKVDRDAYGNITTIEE